MEYRIVGGRANGKTYKLYKQYFINKIQKKIEELEVIDKELGNTYVFDGEIINGIMNWRRKKDIVNDQIEILKEVLKEWEKESGMD